MKPILFTFSLAATLMMAACQLPNPNQSIASMDRYWEFYKTGDYDSLFTFYYEPDSAQLIYIIDSLHTAYGNINKIELGKRSIATTTKGQTIKLIYHLTYDKKAVTQEFVFKKVQDTAFRITEHSFLP